MTDTNNNDRLSVLPFVDAIEVLPGSPTLLEQAIADGWHDGFPPHITYESQLVDLRACDDMVCPTCTTEGLVCWPLHKGSRYRVVAACPRCGDQEEV
jgi:hypothetical protein